MTMVPRALPGDCSPSGGCLESMPTLHRGACQFSLTNRSRCWSDGLIASGRRRQPPGAKPIHARSETWRTWPFRTLEHVPEVEHVEQLESNAGPHILSVLSLPARTMAATVAGSALWLATPLHPDARVGL